MSRREAIALEDDVDSLFTLLLSFTRHAGFIGDSIVSLLAPADTRKYRAPGKCGVLRHQVSS